MPAAGRLRRAPPSQIQITFTRRAKDQFSKGERLGGGGAPRLCAPGLPLLAGGRRGTRAAAPLARSGAAGRGQSVSSAEAAVVAAVFPPGAAALRSAGRRGEGLGPSGGQRPRGRRSGSRRRRMPRPPLAAAPHLPVRGRGTSRLGRRRPPRLPSPGGFCAASAGGRCRGLLVATASRRRKMAGVEAPRAPAGSSRPGRRPAPP